MGSPSFIPQITEADYQGLRVIRQWGGPDGRLRSSWYAVEQQFRTFGCATRPYGARGGVVEITPQREVKTITIREQRFAELDRMIAAGIGEAQQRRAGGRPR